MSSTAPISRTTTCFGFERRPAAAPGIRSRPDRQAIGVRVASRSAGASPGWRRNAVGSRFRARPGSGRSRLDVRAGSARPTGRPGQGRDRDAVLEQRARLGGAGLADDRPLGRQPVVDAPGLGGEIAADIVGRRPRSAAAARRAPARPGRRGRAGPEPAPGRTTPRSAPSGPSRSRCEPQTAQATSPASVSRSKSPLDPNQEFEAVLPVAAQRVADHRPSCHIRAITEI